MSSEGEVEGDKEEVKVEEESKTEEQEQGGEQTKEEDKKEEDKKGGGGDEDQPQTSPTWDEVSERWRQNIKEKVSNVRDHIEETRDKGLHKLASHDLFQRYVAYEDEALDGGGGSQRSSHLGIGSAADSDEDDDTEAEDNETTSGGTGVSRGLPHPLKDPVAFARIRPQEAHAISPEIVGKNKTVRPYIKIIVEDKAFVTKVAKAHPDIPGRHVWYSEDANMQKKLLKPSPSSSSVTSTSPKNASSGASEADGSPSPSSSASVYSRSSSKRKSKGSGLSTIPPATTPDTEEGFFPEMPIRDPVHANLRFVVFQERTLHKDETIGQILVPVKWFLLQSIPEVTVDEESQTAFLSKWFELLLLPEDRFEFAPAIPVVKDTGIPRPQTSLGYVKLDLELRFRKVKGLWQMLARKASTPTDGSASKLSRIGTQLLAHRNMWRYYSLPLQAKAMAKLHNRVSPIPDVAGTVRHLKRQGNRIKDATEFIFSKEFAPCRPVVHAASWENLVHTMLFLLFGSYTILLAPLNFYPVAIFALVFVGALMSRYDKKQATIYRANSPELPKEERPRIVTKEELKELATKEGKKEIEAPHFRYTIFNDEIEDPDDKLNAMQLTSKILKILDKISLILNSVANVIEQVSNAFQFQDELVSAVALFLLFLACVSASAAMRHIPFRPVFFAVFLALMSPPYVRNSVKALHKKFNPDEPAHGEDDDEDILTKMTEKPKVEPRMMIPVVDDFMNIVRRTPTRDELGHLWIAELQVVRDEDKLRLLE